MMSNNKILTVSYGTFSCTLEGFDDSFGTMKAIAEYFRDLAADDRYFGAEPPQPDAEMLARIAEREISRRVEAREQEGRIVLSAGDAAAPAVAAAAIAAPAVMDDNTHADDQSAEAPAIDETPVADEMADAAVDIVADAEDEAVEAAEVEVTEAADDAEPVEAETEEMSHPAAELPEEAAAFFAEAEDEDEDIAGPSAAATDVDDAPENSIAAKLQRIRAVVSQSQDDAEEGEMFEDEHAEDFAPQSDIADVADAQDEGEQDASDVIGDAARAVAESQEVEAQAAAEEDSTEDEDDIAAILARFDTDASDTAAVVTAPEKDTTQEDAVEEAASDEEDDLGLDTLAALMAADTDEGSDEDAGENLFDADEAPAPATPRARVLKVKRADIDAAIASGALEEIADEADDEDETTLSDEDEAELMAELADVEAELAETDAEAETAETPVEPAPHVGDDDVSRLMAEADNQMEEPEGSSRRNAFAHLKAAVMAKKADAGIGADSVEDEGAFRSDLASVVQPRRPAARGARAERPDGKRPAPLKLVAEQRVDVDSAPKGPVRPRRVAAQADVVKSPEDAASFADYASDMGANDLPALLEAAASYLSFVEGRDQFSRPQLMTKVRQVEQGEFSREDGLRSFGQLLRAGKIEKIKGGRFAVTGDIGYRPDQRATG